MADSPHSELALDAPKMAPWRRNPQALVIHYRDTEYSRVLARPWRPDLHSRPQINSESPTGPDNGFTLCEGSAILMPAATGATAGCRA